jgi:4-alpha-glucanotransferase
MEWLIPALCAVFSGTGLWAWFAARATARATVKAAEAAAEPAIQTATTADWSSLMSYWQAELQAVRANANQLEVRLLFLEQLRSDDLDYIEDLHQHIWQELPPPPPVRRPRRTPPEAP